MKDELPACEMIEHLPFKAGPGIGSVAKIGLVVLASDYTMEHEFRHIFATSGLAEGVDYYEARIRNSPQVTPATLAAMGPLLTDTTDLILPGANLDVVAFGYTSASMVLGEEAVAQAIHAARPGAKATNPITAAFAAFDALGAKRIAVRLPSPPTFVSRLSSFSVGSTTAAALGARQGDSSGPRPQRQPTRAPAAPDTGWGWFAAAALAATRT